MVARFRCTGTHTGAWQGLQPTGRTMRIDEVSGQTERNVESTDRQYALVERVVELGWSRRVVEVIDGDLGVSGSAGTARSGVARLTADVALGRAGSCSGCRCTGLPTPTPTGIGLLDLTGITDTLIADADGPGSRREKNGARHRIVGWVVSAHTGGLHARCDITGLAHQPPFGVRTGRR